MNNQEIFTLENRVKEVLQNGPYDASRAARFIVDAILADYTVEPHAPPVFDQDAHERDVQVFANACEILRKLSKRDSKAHEG